MCESLPALRWCGRLADKTMDPVTLRTAFASYPHASR